MSLFDAYIAVDWSASNVPKSGGDSIWISERNASGEACPSVNPRTRGEAMRLLERRISSALAKGERLLVGFDFPFGYPAGTAAPIAGTPVWSALWQVLEDKVSDDEHNRSNRFDVAGELNACLSQAGLLFWGHPANRSYAHLGPKRDGAAYDVISEKRLVETVAKTAQPVWKLAYTGSVGSQALLGIARLNRLRRQFAGQIAVWPFETAFAKDLSRPVVLAEIYPSLVQIDRRIEPKDKAQVEAFTHYLWQADRTNGLTQLLSGPDGLTKEERQRVLSEEGWILGADLSGGAAPASIAAPAPVESRFDRVSARPCGNLPAFIRDRFGRGRSGALFGRRPRSRDAHDPCLRTGGNRRKPDLFAERQRKRYCRLAGWQADLLRQCHGRRRNHPFAPRRGQ